MRHHIKCFFGNPNTLLLQQKNSWCDSSPSMVPIILLLAQQIPTLATFVILLISHKQLSVHSPSSPLLLVLSGFFSYSSSTYYPLAFISNSIFPAATKLHLPIIFYPSSFHPSVTGLSDYLLLILHLPSLLSVLMQGFNPEIRQFLSSPDVAWSAELLQQFSAEHLQIPSINIPCHIINKFKHIY